MAMTPMAALYLVCIIHRDHYHLTLTATDAGSPALSSNLSVIIVIDDVNDNSPLFDHAAYEVTLDVTVPVNSFVVRVSARDADSGENGRVSYRFAVRTQVYHTYTKIHCAPLEKGSVSPAGSHVIRITAGPVVSYGWLACGT